MLNDMDKTKVTIRLEIRQLDTICRALSVSNWPGAKELADQLARFLKRRKDEETLNGLERIFGKRW